MNPGTGIPPKGSVAKVLADYVIKASELILASRLEGHEKIGGRQALSGAGFSIHIPELFALREEEEVAKKDWFEQRAQKCFVLEILLKPTDPNADAEKLSYVLEKWTFAFQPGALDTDRHVGQLITKTRVTLRALMCLLRTMQAHSLCRNIRAAEVQGSTLPYRRAWVTRTDSWPPTKFARYDNLVAQQDFTTLSCPIGTLRVSYATLQGLQLQQVSSLVLPMRGVPVPVPDNLDVTSFDDGAFDLVEDNDDDGIAGTSFGSAGSIRPADGGHGTSFGSAGGAGSDGRARSRVTSGSSVASGEVPNVASQLKHPRGLPTGPITLGPASVGSQSAGHSPQISPREATLAASAGANVSAFALSRTASPKGQGQVVSDPYAAFHSADGGDDADDLNNIWMPNFPETRRRSMCTTSSFGSRSPSASGRRSPPYQNRRKSSSFDSLEGPAGSKSPSQDLIDSKDIFGEAGASICMQGFGSDEEGQQEAYSNSSGSARSSRDDEEEDLLNRNVVASAVKGSDCGAFVSNSTALRSSFKGFSKEVPCIESPPFQSSSPPMCPSQSTWLHMLVSPPTGLQAHGAPVPLFESLPAAAVEGTIMGAEGPRGAEEAAAFLEDDPEVDQEIEALREEMGALMCLLEAHQELKVCKQELDLKKTLHELGQLTDSW